MTPHIPSHPNESPPREKVKPFKPSFLFLFLLFFPLSVAGCKSGTGHSLTERNLQTPHIPSTTPEHPFTCNPLLPGCMAPCPSSLITRFDESSLTGIRLDLSEETFSRSFGPGILRKGSNLLKPMVFNHSDGFSPLGLIIVPLQEAIDPASLPTPEASMEVDSPVFLVDMASGERVPIDIQLDAKGLQQDPPQYILVATTRDRVAFRSPLLMVLTKGLKKPDGNPVNPIYGFQAVKGVVPVHDPELQRLKGLYQPLLEYMELELDMDLDQVLLAFDLTLRSEESLTRVPLSMREQVLDRAGEAPPDFQIESVRTSPTYGEAVMEVLGRYPSPDFRSEDHTLRLDEDGLPVSEEDDRIQLLLLLPPGAAEKPAPVVIFGHGFMIMKESLIQCSAALTDAGFAVLGIDVAAHGSRSRRDGFIGDYLKVESLFQMRDAILQTVADQVQLCRLLEGRLGDLDLIPYRSQEDHGDGVPDLDVSRIFFISQSLGSMIGTTFLAYEPSVEAGVLNVPGGGLLNIFRNATSVLVEIFASGFLPSKATPLELLQLMALEQMPFDLIDPLNYAHHVIRDPLPGCVPKQVLLQQSVGDGLVPHAGTASLARTLDIPLLVPPLVEIPDVGREPVPADSNGVFQYLVHENPLLAHGLLLMHAPAHRQILEYLRSTLDSGVARIIDPEA